MGDLDSSLRVCIVESTLWTLYTRTMAPGSCLQYITDSSVIPRASTLIKHVFFSIRRLNAVTRQVVHADKDMFEGVRTFQMN